LKDVILPISKVARRKILGVVLQGSRLTRQFVGQSRSLQQQSDLLD